MDSGTKARKIAEGSVKRELNGVLVDGLGRTRLDQLFEEAGSALVHAKDTLHRVDDVGGYDLAAVVKLGTLAQRERVLEAVIGN